MPLSAALTFDLWTCDPKHCSAHPCTKMNQSWKSGEIQSSNYRTNKAKSAFFSKLGLHTLTYWPQNYKRSSLSQNAPMLKVWWKYVQYLSSYYVNNILHRLTRQTDRQTDRQTHEQPEYITPLATGGITILLMRRTKMKTDEHQSNRQFNNVSRQSESKKKLDKNSSENLTSEKKISIKIWQVCSIVCWGSLENTCMLFLTYFIRSPTLIYLYKTFVGRKETKLLLRSR